MDLTDAGLLSCIDTQVALLKNTLPHARPKMKVSITISAKNEENFLLDALKALVAQIDEEGNFIDPNIYEVILLCHNCTDDTYNIAFQFKEAHPAFNLLILELNSEVINNIGAARRVLMQIAADRLHDENAWILTTDADTIPNPKWVHEILTQSYNYDMICGKINVNTQGLSEDVKNLLAAKISYNSLKTHLESIILYDPCDPWPKHNYHSGPSLALRKKVYVAIDGIPPVPFLEDIKLYNRVRASGYAIRHLNSWEVETSGRLLSKTACGLGSELKNWSKNEVEYHVEDMDTLIKRFGIYEKIKTLFHNFNSTLMNDLAQSGYLDLSMVIQIYESSRNYQEMTLKIEEKLNENLRWRMTHPLKDIFEVNAQLEEYLESIISVSSAT